MAISIALEFDILILIQDNGIDRNRSYIDTNNKSSIVEHEANTSKIADDQLFYLGGTTSVRGFDENQLLIDYDDDAVGGKLMASGNAEARIDLGLNFELSFFFDAGYLDDTSGDERSNKVRYSTGIGFRYVTPIGAVGLVYGHKLNPESYESSGRLHFSIGYTF